MKTTTAPISRRLTPKLAPKVALVQLDAAASEVLRKAFGQCGIQTVQIADDFAKRLGMEQFQGCVVRLDEHASAILHAVRSSRSNHRIILYGILTEGADVRTFSKYGINALLDSRLDRNAVLNVARSTCALLLNELRRYVRIPLVVEVAVESRSRKLSASSREISGGGMSLQLTEPPQQLDNLRLAFTLPDKPAVSIGAIACWQREDLIGFQFESADPARQVVKDWINTFLGLD
jgi:hypothetical protein